ncbi:MAG: alkaline phosphatase family protein [Thermoplasmata archaeon]|nr:alkaline phosphatase family protein [Thermoplasmata archaeon]
MNWITVSILVVSMLVSVFTFGASMPFFPQTQPHRTPVAPSILSHVKFSVLVTTPVASPSFTSHKGDAILLFFTIFGKNTVKTVTDSVGDTFSQLVYTFQFTSNWGNDGTAIWAAYNVSGGASVAVTATLQGPSPQSNAIGVVDVSGVAASPLDHLAVQSNSTGLGSGSTAQQSKNFSNRVLANNTDLVLSAVAARNYDLWSAAGVDTLIDNMVAPVKGTYMTMADFQFKSTSTANVWMNGTSNRSAAWIADSLSLKSAPLPPPPKYSITFSESGLPSGLQWNVTLTSLGVQQTATSPASIVFSEMNGSYAFVVKTPSGWTPTPGAANVTVNGGPLTQPIAFSQPKFAVTFIETGLDAGTTWSITLNGTQNSTAAPGSNVFAEPNGTFSFTVGSVPGYSVFPASGAASVSGQPQTVSIGFTKVPMSYNVTFTETGLPGTTSWSVTLNGSKSTNTAPNSILFSEPNGTFAYSVTSPILGYNATPISGNVPVNGSPVIVPIVYRLPSSYNVTFTETGLASGSWTVTLGARTLTASVPNSIIFSVLNGNYCFSVTPVPTYNATPAAGCIPVSGGPASQPVAFKQAPTYVVSFNETGLTSGVTWSVTLGVATLSNNSPGPINFVRPNGSYGFTVANVPGYLVNSSSGLVVVNGSPVTRPISFTKIQPSFFLNFTETSLPSSLRWAVTVGGTTRSALAPGSISFTEINGTYNYSVTGLPPGYAASPSPGTAKVNGTNVTVAITFYQAYRAGNPGNSTNAFIQHVVVIVMENIELSTLNGNGWSKAPYQGYLAKTYGFASNFYGACHSSLPQYIAMTAGTAVGCTAVSSRAAHLNNIGDLLENASFSWGAYFESMPSACYKGNYGAYPLYTNTHNPFIYYNDIGLNASRCNSHVVNSAVFNASLANGSLPNFAYYVPNNVDDCHGNQTNFVPIPSCDGWLRNFLSPIENHTGNYSSPQARSVVNHTAFFVLYDEGTTGAGYSIPGYATKACTLNGTNSSSRNYTVCGGHTYLVVVSPYSLGQVWSANSATFSLLSTVEWLFSLDNCGNPESSDGTQNFPAMTSLFSFGWNGYQNQGP